MKNFRLYPQERDRWGSVDMDKEQYRLDQLYNERYKEVARGVDSDWLSQPARTACPMTIPCASTEERPTSITNCPDVSTIHKVDRRRLSPPVCSRVQIGIPLAQPTDFLQSYQLQRNGREGCPMAASATGSTKILMTGYTMNTAIPTETSRGTTGIQ